MKEHPIIFSGPMVQAILEGRKTQTRRVIKGLGSRLGDEYCTELRNGELVETATLCPYGVAGDHLWVRETWQAQNLDGQWWHEVKRDDRSVMNWAWTNPVQRAYLPMPPRWLPAIHMPRMACRITLEVLSVRVERVQDISERDAIAEGIDVECISETDDLGLDISGCDYRDYSDPSGITYIDSPIRSYRSLWNLINAKRGYGWDANSWVWVIEFRQVAA